MNSKQRLRARGVLILIAIGAGLLAVSLYWMQVVDGPTYAAKADRQYIKPDVAQFDRGTIYFSGKDGTPSAAASLGNGYVITMNPSLVADPASEFAALSEYLKLDRTDFVNKAQKANDRYEVLANEVDASTAQSVRAIQLPGVTVLPETWRSYPNGTMGAQVLGLVAEDASSSAVVGRYGLERSYNSVLGRPPAASGGDVFAELFGGIRQSVFGGTAKEGDVVTTIEPSVEKYLDTILAQTQAAWHPDEIGGIIIDPRNGEIVAMDTLPTFDPNNTASVKNVSILSDPLVEHVYEMGSIMKPLTMSTALDSGAVQPDSTYDDLGCLTLNTRKICNYDGRARGIIPMQQILSQSLNVGAATLALKVGKTDFAKYFDSFGFADKTGVDLPNEASNIIKNLSQGSDIDIATASYGQGIAVSPMSMVRALSVIASGGYLITPHVAKEIDYTDGTTQKIVAPKTGPVLSQKTIGEITDMLVTVVDKALKNGAIRMDHYTMAAKTGTAQIADPVHGGYYTDRYLHSFFGFFPAYQPRFVVFLYQIYPKGAEYASETLTDPYDNLAKFLINYYSIPPDR